jgi:hypothetical protein
MDSNAAGKVGGCPYLGAVQWVDTLLKEFCRMSEKYSSFQKFIMNLNMPEGKSCVS